MMDEPHPSAFLAEAAQPATFRFPLLAAGLVTIATLVIGAGALWSGVPWAAVAITALAVGGITASTIRAGTSSNA